jgi:hypothetical protein
MTNLENFWAKVHKTETCWVWTGAASNNYGKFGFQGKMVLAHRLSYGLAKGVMGNK